MTDSRDSLNSPAPEPLPLLDLFNALRAAGFALGLEEYELLLKALQHGFGLPDRVALARLCHILWVKTPDETRRFEVEFARLFGGRALEITRHRTTTSDVLSRPSPRSQPKRDQPSHLHQVAGSELQPPSPANTATSQGPVGTSSHMNIGDEVERSLTMIDLTAPGPAEAESEPDSSHFLMQSDYFPITQRQMKQSWRYFRRPIREGPPVELDIRATIESISRQALLLEPVLRPQRVNKAEVLLLVDQDGSMIPFHGLSHRLVDTAEHGGRLGKTVIAYFHNVPVDYLYQDSFLLEPELLDQVLIRLDSRQAAALIFSDAGAARGSYNRERLHLTATFLSQLRHHILSIAWLNPMPRSRWTGTSAARIAQMVPMFQTSQAGFDHAIDVLRGRQTTLGMGET